MLTTFSGNLLMFSCSGYSYITKFYTEARDLKQSVNPFPWYTSYARIHWQTKGSQTPFPVHRSHNDMYGTQSLVTYTCTREAWTSLQRKHLLHLTGTQNSFHWLRYKTVLPSPTCSRSHWLAFTDAFFFFFNSSNMKSLLHGLQQLDIRAAFLCGHFWPRLLGVGMGGGSVSGTSLLPTRKDKYN